MKDATDEVAKRPYTKPEMRRVQLQPEESFAAGCKTVSGSGPISACELPSSCFNYGS